MKKGDPSWLGLTRKKIFEIIPSRKAKKASPGQNFDKILDRSGYKS